MAQNRNIASFQGATILNLPGTGETLKGMVMTLTLDIPDELASELAALFPQEERSRFAVAAIADALTAWQREADARLAESLLAALDPEKEPEREAAEYIAIVEEGLDDVEAGRNLVSFEEACHRWEAEKAERRATGRV